VPICSDQLDLVGEESVVTVVSDEDEDEDRLDADGRNVDEELNLRNAALPNMVALFPNTLLPAVLLGNEPSAAWYRGRITFKR
jgi:hypothetical protein